MSLLGLGAFKNDRMLSLDGRSDEFQTLNLDH